MRQKKPKEQPPPASTMTRHPPAKSQPAQRQTAQKQAIRHCFEHADRPLAPEEVLRSAITQTHNLGIATVYRSLKTLVQEGWLKIVNLPNQPPRYERANLAHHHHFQCRQCLRVFDVPGCNYHHHHTLPKGFRIETHEIWLHGLCNQCLPTP